MLLHVIIHTHILFIKWFNASNINLRTGMQPKIIRLMPCTVAP